MIDDINRNAEALVAGGPLRKLDDEPQGKQKVREARQHSSVDRQTLWRTGRDLHKGKLMKLTLMELGLLKPRGVYLTERCDCCRKLLNQSWHYTVAGKPEVFCSGLCRDTRFFSEARTARKYANPGHCSYCGANLAGRKRGTLFCDDGCRKGFARRGPITTTPRPQKSRTPDSWNQALTTTNLGR